MRLLWCDRGVRRGRSELLHDRSELELALRGGGNADQHADGHAHRDTDGYTDRDAYRNTDRYANRHADRYSDVDSFLDTYAAVRWGVSTVL